MGHFVRVPDWIWVALAGIVILGAVLYARMLSRRAAQQQRRKARRTKRIAKSKAWHWLHGKPKQLRLTDKRHENQGDDS